MDKNDCALLIYKRFIAGDNDALEELISVYADELLYFITSKVHDFFAAEEILSDTFMQIVVKKQNFRGDSSMKTYLFAIARNLSVSYIRKDRRKTELTVPLTEAECADLRSLEDSVIKSERDSAICRAANSLNPEYREIIHLVFFDSLSTSEAGRIMKKSSRQAQNLLYRAKAALREKLESEGINYENI